MGVLCNNTAPRPLISLRKLPRDTFPTQSQAAAGHLKRAILGIRATDPVDLGCAERLDAIARALVAARLTRPVETFADPLHSHDEPLVGVLVALGLGRV